MDDDPIFLDLLTFVHCVIGRYYTVVIQTKLDVIEFRRTNKPRCYCKFN